MINGFTSGSVYQNQIIMNKTKIEEIKADLLFSRKNKVGKSIEVLTTLLGEAVSIGKNDGNRETTDLEVIALVKKFIDNNSFTLSKIDPQDPRVADLIQENNILNYYLPRQLTSDDVKQILESLQKPLIMKDAMSHMKANYAGTYDGKMVSQLIKEMTVKQ